jgi:serpin B
VLVSTLASSAKKKGYELSVANALWGQKGEGFLQPFLNLMNRYYGAGFREVDFTHDAEGAAKQINSWAERETRGKIKGVIPSGALDSLTRLAVTSAVYFKGMWDERFAREQTRTQDFRVTPEQRVQVPMMHSSALIGYYFEAEKLQVLEMPYKGDRLSMVILLPRQVDGLDALEEAFCKSGADEWLRGLEQGFVNVSLPRFAMTVQSRMDEALKSLGMTDAFALPQADFSDMNGRRDLFLGAVLHKAFVDVNEEGTEAAVVTAVPATRLAIAVARNRFWADHPFLFLIRDRRTGCILFLGRLKNPSI